MANCASDLPLFLCSLYAPPCMRHKEKVPPCRSLCSRVRIGCESLMNRFGFSWPKMMACERFPEASPNTLCLDRPNMKTRQPSLTATIRKGMFLLPLWIINLNSQRGCLRTFTEHITIFLSGKKTSKKNQIKRAKIVFTFDDNLWQITSFCRPGESNTCKPFSINTGLELSVKLSCARTHDKHLFFSCWQPTRKFFRNFLAWWEDIVVPLDVSLYLN